MLFLRDHFNSKRETAGKGGKRHPLAWSLSAVKHVTKTILEHIFLIQ